MSSSGPDVLSLRERLGFLTDDLISSISQLVRGMLAKRKKPVASKADLQQAAVMLTDDAVSHLAMVEHDLKSHGRILTAEQVAKLDAIERMAEQLSSSSHKH